MLTNGRRTSDTSLDVESVESACDNHNVLKQLTKRVVPLQDATGVAVPGCLQPQPYFLAGDLQWVETNPSNIRFSLRTSVFTLPYGTTLTAYGCLYADVRWVGFVPPGNLDF
jgi:hypothetical protein